MALADTYVGAAGAKIYCGMNPPSGGGGGATPAWLVAAGNTVNKAVAIPGITGGGGAVMTAWGSFDIRQTTGEIYVGPQSGHGDGNWNGVTKFDATSDSPAWATANAATPSGQCIVDAFYNADGKPAARHMYDHWHWCPVTDQFVMIGGSGTWTSGNDLLVSDAFNPVTNLWSAQGTWPYIGGTGFGCGIDTLRGNIWTNGFKRVSTTSRTYLTDNISPVVVPNIRYPMAYDSLRDQMFSLIWGSGGPSWPTNGTVMNASVFPAGGGAQRAITFNSSAGYSQFVADALNGAYAGMTYNPDLDVFYWYADHGQAGATAYLYVITPNNGTVWDMSIFNFATGSATLERCPASGAGINGRIKYHKLMKGIVINPAGNGQWYFIKTS